MLRYSLRELVRNGRRTLASVTGVALGVGLFASIGFFVDGSAASMTRRAVAPVTLDMQALLTSPLASSVTLRETTAGQPAPGAGMIRLLRGTWSLAALDLALWRRSPAAIAAALVPPAAMALLLYVLTLAVGQQPVALVMEAHGRHALHMEGIFKNEADTYLLTETDRQTAMRMLAAQQVAAVVIVPKGFDDLIPPAPPATNLPTTDMMAGRQRATLQLVLNNVDIDLADDIRRTVAKSVAEFDAPAW